MNVLRLWILWVGVAVPTLLANSLGEQLQARLNLAAAGEEIVVEPGVYEGAFTIEHSLRLIGLPGAVLQGNRKTHVIAVRAPDVEISGFTIRGSGRALARDEAAIHVTGPRAVLRNNRILDSLHGIYIRQADNCRIEHNLILGDGVIASTVADPLAAGLKPGEAELCDVETIQDRRGNGIHLWNSQGHIITENTIKGTRDGIYFSFADSTTVRRNLIEGTRYGLHYMYSDFNTFEDNTFSGNAAGSALMYSKGILLRANLFIANRSHRAYGILFQSVDDTRVENNRIEGNTLGFYLENSNHVSTRHNTIAGNYIGLRVSDSTSDSRFVGNSFRGNIHPVETNGANATSTWSVNGRGNFWEGAFPLDLNRDGVGDLPHRETDLFGSWRRTFPAIGLLSASPGERLLRFIHGRIALPHIPGVTDHYPLLSEASSGVAP